MNPAITAAIIAGICAIIAPIVAVFVTRAVENRVFVSVTKVRREALVGPWEGWFRQEDADGNKSILVPVSGHLVCRWKKVEATITISYPPELGDYTASVRLSGGFFHDRFVRLDYRNADDSVMQFGSVILKLSANCKTMTGSLIGYGPLTESIRYAEVEIHKKS